jgi:ubiquinone/menaquinone biosynthesis C-methylase UbiE
MMSCVPDDIEFRPGLFHGTAEHYDRFRIGYPRLMLADLVQRAAVSSRGRLIDLACGTGQIAVALADTFTGSGQWTWSPT